MSVCRSEELQAPELSPHLQTPTLIGCVFLMNYHKILTPCKLFAVISWALYSSTLFKPQSNKHRFKFIPLQTQKPPIRLNRGLRVDWSLTMTYFHTGIRTIIGAKAFHCPVRDGKEWYHLAMVIRHNLLPCWFLVKESTQRIHRVYQLLYIFRSRLNNLNITNIRTYWASHFCDVYNKSKL